MTPLLPPKKETLVLAVRNTSLLTSWNDDLNLMTLLARIKSPSPKVFLAYVGPPQPFNVKLGGLILLANNSPPKDALGHNQVPGLRHGFLLPLESSCLMDRYVKRVK